MLLLFPSCNGINCMPLLRDRHSRCSSLRIISMVSAVKRFNRPSTTAVSKENRGRLSRSHDLPRTRENGRWLCLPPPSLPPDLAGYRERGTSFPVISRSYVFQPPTWPLVSTRRVWIPTCTHMCTHTNSRSANPSNPNRISRACARQKWPISTDRLYSRAKSTLSHTPTLSLNCFGKALTAESAS